MKIVIDTTDVTGDLFDDGVSILTDELERGKFERIVGDIHITLSNSDRKYHNFFASTIASTVHYLYIYNDDNSRRYVAILDVETIRFSLEQETVEFDAFSLLKDFYDKARDTVIIRDTSRYIGYPFNRNTFLTFDQFFRFQMKESGMGAALPWLHNDIQIAAEYQSEVIRNYGPVSVTDIGSSGRLQNLDPATTMYDVIDAICVSFNAEFIVDFPTLTIHLVKRAQPTNETHVLDEIIRTDQQPTVVWVDDQKIDYIRGYGLYVPPSPVLEKAEYYILTGNIKAGPQVYVATGTIGPYEVCQSDPLDFTLDPRTGDPTEGYTVTLALPEWDDHIETRRIYRKDVNGVFRAVFDTLGPGIHSGLVDNMSMTELLTRPAINPITSTFNVYRRYDEVAALWDDDIVDFGDQQVTGKVFQAVPHLRFLNYDGTEMPDQPYETHKFFGGGVNYVKQKWQDRWIDLFRTRRVFKARLAGVNFYVGDRLSGTRWVLPNDLTEERTYVVRRSAINFLKEYTDVEAMSE